MDWLFWWSNVILLPAFIVILAFVHVWAFIEGATVPNLRWRAIRRNKALWLVLIWFTGGIVGIYYLLVLRRRLRPSQAPAAAV